MLRKQGRQAETLDLHSEILNEHTKLLKNQIDISNKQTESIIEMKDVLKEFTALSVEHFQKQDKFNETFLKRLDEISKKP